MTKGNAGRLTTSGLFKEGKLGGPDAPYSLERFKDVFMGSFDSSGYICAQEMLTLVPQKDRWAEWKRLFERNAELRRYHEAWKEEMEIRVRSNAESLVASGCDKETFPRLRWILDGNLYGKRKVGRPTKGELSKKERVAKGVKAHNQKSPLDLDKTIDLAAQRDD